MDEKIKLKFQSTRNMVKYRGRELYFKDGSIGEVDRKRGEALLRDFPDNFIDVTPPTPLTMLGCRFIEDLHNIHKGKEIWVLGCGPSLDDFPDDFFDYDEENPDSKIAIACTWSMIAFPNCAYTAISQSNREQLSHVLENRRHLLHRHIVRLTPSQVEGRSIIGPEPIYLRMNDIDLLNPTRTTAWHASLPRNLLNGIPMELAYSGTCIHTEIQAAIVMGAKKVTLAGCEARNLKFQGHARKRGMDKIYGYQDREAPENGYPDYLLRGESPGQKRMRAGTAFLAKIMKPYGVQIARYYYGKGYEEVN